MQTEIPQVECEALVALHYYTAGTSWTNQTNWLDFSNNPALVKSDFAAAPSVAYAGSFQFTPSSLAYPLFITSVKSSALQYLNLVGITQFRLRYTVDDNNNLQADYLKIFCGDMLVPFNRPVLRVWYYVP